VFIHQLSPLVSDYIFCALIRPKSHDIHVGKCLFTTWLHGLPLTPSVAQMFSCRVCSMEASYSNNIYGPWLPRGRNEGWNSEAGVQLTPIESVISQDCQIGDALAAQDERMLIQRSSSVSLYNFQAALPLCPPLLGWAGVELPVLFLCRTRVQGSSNSSQKLRSQHKSEPTGTDCCGTSRLLQTRVDLSAACPSFYLPNLFFATP